MRRAARAGCSGGVGPHRRFRLASAASPGRRAAPRLGPLRRPRRLHDARRGPRRRGDAGTPEPLLRSRPRRHRPLRRHGREVHRRRGDGRLGRADGARGRRRAGRAGGPRPRRRGQDARPGDPGPRRRPDRRGGRHPRRHEPGHGRRRPRQHRQPPAVRRAAGHRPRRRGDPARGQRAIAFEAAGRADAQGQGGAGAGVAGPARRRRGRRPEPRRDPRGAVRRPRRRAAPAQGPLPRHDPRGPRAPRLGHRPGRHRQDPPRLGVPQVPRRPRRDASGTTTAAPPPTARGSASGPWARWSAAGPGLLETDDEATTRAKIAATLAEHVPDPDERRWIEPALLALLGVESGAPAEQLFGAWRTFFERLAATAPVVLVFEDFHFADSGPARLRRPPARVDAGTSRSTSSRSRGRSCSSGGPTGARASATSPRSTSSRCPSRRCASCSPASSPACRSRRCGRSSAGPTASRSTPSRPSGCSSPEGRLAIHDGVYVPAGRPHHPRRAGDADGPHRRAAGRPGRQGPRARPDAAVLGQSFTLAALAAVSGTDEADLEPRLRALVRRELLTLEADPRSPERGQYAFVQALIREVAYGTLDQAGPQGPAPRGRPLLRVPRLGRAGRRPGRPLPGGPCQRDRRSGGRCARRPGADRPAGRGRARREPRGARPGGRVPDAGADRGERPREQADLLERAGTSAGAAARLDVAQALLQDALLRWRELGIDRPSPARPPSSARSS